MPDAEFIIAVVAIASGTFLLTVRMIISAIKWKMKQKGGSSKQENSLALGELEEIVRSASQEANLPLAKRLKEVEQHLYLLSEAQVNQAQALPVEDGGMKRISLDDDEPAKTVGRVRTPER